MKDNKVLFTSDELLAKGFELTSEGGFQYFIMEFGDGSAMVTEDLEDDEDPYHEGNLWRVYNLGVYNRELSESEISDKILAP
jgi:hypothetical protein